VLLFYCEGERSYLPADLAQGASERLRSGEGPRPVAQWITAQLSARGLPQEWLAG
jgi:hypothetical protein